MTRREKVLATTLLVVMTVMGGGVLFHLFVYQPISDVREELVREQTELTKKQNELLKEQQQIEAVLRVDPRLSQWQKLSLPPSDPEAKKKKGVSPEELKKKHLSQLQVEYERFLSLLLRRNGFADDSVIITPRQPDRRSSPILKGKEPVYERLAFGVSGRSTLDAVSKMLRELHTTPLLHSVRNLTVAVATPRGTTPMPAGTLDLSMTVEALLVNGAEERTALLPSKLGYQPRVLAEPRRSYDLMVKRNVFTGIVPKSLPEEEKVTEEKRDVLRFVKLTMLFYNPDRRRWEATLYDQGKGGAEIKLNQRILNEIKILDKDENPMLEGKVVHIDETQLIFKSDGKYYRLRCGDFFYPAIREPMSSKELKEVGLTTSSGL
jgi:hypothetical protein